MATGMRAVLLLCALTRASAITTGIFASCAGPSASSLAHCDASLAPEARVAALLGQLSTDEKIALLSPTQTPFCACHTLANDGADLGVYRWLVETNSGVSAPCLAPGRCPTMFVGPLGVAAAFNRSAWERKGDVIGRELRALANVAAGRYGRENYTLYDKATVGLTGFGPNVNLVKDPRRRPASPSFWMGAMGCSRRLRPQLGARGRGPRPRRGVRGGLREGRPAAQGRDPAERGVPQTLHRLQRAPRRVPRILNDGGPCEIRGGPFPTAASSSRAIFRIPESPRATRGCR